ncbi:protein kinase domain-containing protein [Bremerella sp. T1]|uniref:WD40 repeat domain-containing serine/threonine protein kinase n=1 Tax=Bremerella sp. TYQ1 TaxID=3119568 RepID=UPI001CD0269A|nr:WD40 repeat domain-containing serine/threonine protein kinase [Bremerella volcania]UBM36913.1 WD40 repeat domain-containing serine/threonine protein kinase [Bremerella volcania]
MFNQGDKPIPGYRLERFLGRGQFGEVWAADGPGGTLVALKFIALQQKTGIRELKSIQAVKRIKHANLCSVNAMWLLGQDGGVLDDHEIDLLIRNQTKDQAPISQTLALDQTQTLQNPQYLVVSMTLADGSLEERLKMQEDGGIPREELQDYMLQAARGIDFLNSPVHLVDGDRVGIQHRDIKPANLLFAGDSVLVGDFGVAAAFGEYDTEATSVVGSLCYMSPESIKRMPSHSSDQYALAITYYQLRTAALPFEPTVSFAELVEIHVRGKLQFPLVTEHERAVLARATSTDPKQRYASCVEFIKAFSPPTEQAAPVTSAVPLPAMIGGAVAMVALIGALLWGIFGGGFNGSSNAGPAEQLTSHTILFTPEETIYDIAIVPEEPRDDITSTGESAANINLLPTDRVRITARAEDSLYQPLEQEFTVEQLTRNDWQVTLQPIPQETLLSKITTLAGSGNWEEAERTFADAAKIYPALQDQPESVSVELNGTPAVPSHSREQTHVATAIVSDGSGQLKVLPVTTETQEMIGFYIAAPPHQLQLLAGNKTILFIEDSLVDVHSVAAGKPSYKIELGQETETPYRQITDTTLSPDQKQLFVGLDHQKVALLGPNQTAKPLEKIAEAPFATRVDAVAFDPSGKHAFAIGQSGDIYRWPVDAMSDNTAEKFQLGEIDEEVLALHPVSDDRLLAFTVTKLLDITLASAEVNTVADLRADLFTSRLTEDGKHLVFSTLGEAQPLSVLNIASGELTTIRPPDIRGLVEDFDIISDGRWVVYADSDGALFALDLTETEIIPLALRPTPGERIKFVRVAADGSAVMTLAEDGTTTWWNLVQLLLAAQSTADES